MKNEKAEPRLNIRFLYTFCNDVAEARRFYSELLGLNEVSHMDNEQMGWLNYQCAGFNFMIFRLDGKAPVEERWAWQPGGTIESAVQIMSFSVEVPWADFRDVVARLQAAGVKAQNDQPQWRQQSYWGWAVKDPMGNTVEVYSAPSIQPPEGQTPQWDE